jgi:hypothetical protein
MEVGIQQAVHVFLNSLFLVLFLFAELRVIWVKLEPEW